MRQKVRWLRAFGRPRGSPGDRLHAFVRHDGLECGHCLCARSLTLLVGAGAVSGRQPSDAARRFVVLRDQLRSCPPWQVVG